MAVKNCCIESCKSCSIRKEDTGVTYHKYPKDQDVRNIWISVTRQTPSDLPLYVCSRHFCKNDFQMYRESKYVLKSDAVPSIFPWTIKKRNNKTKMEEHTDNTNQNPQTKNDNTELNSSKESEAENVDIIQKFIDSHEITVTGENVDEPRNDGDNQSVEEMLMDVDEPAPAVNEDVEGVKDDEPDKKDDIDDKEVAVQHDIKYDESDIKVDNPDITDDKSDITDAESDIKDDDSNINDESNIKYAESNIKDDKSNMKDNESDIKSDKSDIKGDVSKTDDDIVSKYKQILKETNMETPQEQETKDNIPVSEEVTKKTSIMEMIGSPSQIISNVKSPKISEGEDADEKQDASNEPKQMAASMLDMILTQSEARIATKKSPKILPKVRMGDKGGQALSVGSKVEARDFGEDWYPAQIMEVDYDEMEVLVHYENVNKKHDEWISVSSPRLRPIGSPAIKPATPKTPDVKPVTTETPEPSVVEVKEEIKEEKPKLTFEVGERCLARWRDNRRFIATITKDLGGGKYDIVFDDGAPWSCTISRLHKLKEPQKKDILSVDTMGTTAIGSPSPDLKPGTPLTASNPVPIYNTHLFDPTRDYLGSKRERREMKRKLNIKEIFNIGQKKKKLNPKERKETPGKKKKVKSKLREILETDNEVKKEIPDAIASIIGTVSNEKGDIEIKDEPLELKPEMLECKEDADSETLSAPESHNLKMEVDEVSTLTDEQRVKHEQDLHRIKVVINKLEDGIKTETLKTEIKVEKSPEKKKKIKKSKKLRLLQEKKVKKEVEIVKNELEEMKRQVEEMKKEMLLKSEELKKQSTEMPESFLLPGEWCCKWVNGQPVGSVSEIESVVKSVDGKPGLPRRSVQVEDKRLPAGWTKHMVRRSVGNSAGKWDVVLISPENKRFHTKTDMRHYLEANPEIFESLKKYEHALFDFGIHVKLSRRMGWYITTPDGQQENPTPLPIGILSTTSPLVKRKSFSLKRKESLKRSIKKEKKKLRKLKMPKIRQALPTHIDNETPGTSGSIGPPPVEQSQEFPPLEDGYVYVGSLKVQIIGNLLRCPAEGCLKNFRNNTLLKMHIKHYHGELKKQLGATPKVLDLAYARAKPTQVEMRRLKLEVQKKTIKIKLPRLNKKFLNTKLEIKQNDTPLVQTPMKLVEKLPKLPRSIDSPKLRKVLSKQKGPKVLLPIRRPEENEIKNEIETEPLQPFDEMPPELEPLDFETAISTHTVTKPPEFKVKEKKRKYFASVAKKTVSEEEDWFGVNSDVETRSSFPRSGTPDSKILEQKLVSSESNEEQKSDNRNDMYMFSETGDRIKIVRMKREEIINCHCGFREEDGLMVQCELCLCWQHALCHNIQKEAEVPEKYTCSICLNPRRGRRSRRFLHDQDRLYEGLLPGAKPCEALRRSHELSGNLIRIEDALHALRVKYYVATKKNHPKLYLWAKDWETGEIAMTQERLNSDYSDLNVMMANIGKENLPLTLKPEEIRFGNDDDQDERFSQRDNALGPQSLLSGLLSSPGGASLDLPLSTSDLDKLAKSVQAQDISGIMAPMPEAAIENGACRERLLRHIQRCQALIDARLDSIEAQVAELESQDPSFEDDETADYFPRTKQTIQMLMRDLDTMEELGVVT